MNSVLFAVFLLLVTVLLPQAAGHTYLSGISLNGDALDEGDCVRPHPPTVKENPIPLVTAPDMTCGWLPYAAQPANRACPIQAGETIGLQWHHTSTSPDDDIISPSHVGPCLVYLAKSDTGAGPVWFKIFEQGYDPSTQKWCVDILLANKGLFTVTLPSDIAPGNYLLRGEILALHGANAPNGVQPYVGCVELAISGSGHANPAGVAIPGTYTSTDPGMFFDIYQPYSSYPIPGPPVYKSGSSANSSPTAAPTTKPSTAPTSEPATKAPTSAPVAPTSAPVAPTSAPVAPTSAPVAPTSAPVAPTTAPVAPTSAPVAPTSAPVAPTSAPVAPISPTSPVLVQLFPSSSEWWLAATARSDPATAIMELADSGILNSWHTFQPTSWGYWTFPALAPLVLPISLRLTSVTGEQIELHNIFTTWSDNTFLNTGKIYDSSTSSSTSPSSKVPTSATSAPQPTSAPPSQPTAAPPSPTTAASTPTTAIKLLTHEGSSQWWFAVTFSGTSQDITAVALKDSDSLTDWHTLEHATWGYWVFTTLGSPLVAPITFRLTSANGETVTFEMTSIQPNNELDTLTQFA